MQSSHIMVIMIVLIVSIAGVMKAKYGPRGKRGQHLGEFDAPPALPSANEAELQREVESLRERIKVLERIATEERHTRAIAHEIESLRDKV